MPTGCYQHKISSEKELFDERTLRSIGCWVWNGTINRGGYGVLTVGGRCGAKKYAHRVAYELFVGPIPKGKELDHLCRNRWCVNPSHLEPVTRRVNIIRGIGPQILGALNGTKTHCCRGHPFDAENTRYRPSGGRTCRECERGRRRAQG